MILLVAVAAGLVAGSVRARMSGRTFAVPSIQSWWLAPIAFVPQYVAFFQPATRDAFPQNWATAALIGSQALLLVFVWSNRRYLPFWVMGLGLVMNLAVISLNGGLMPISAATLERLSPDVPVTEWQVGKQLGSSKNVLLPADATRLEFLADRFFLPSWVPYSVAYSLGDVLIAAGVFWFLWRAGGPQYAPQS